MTPAGIEAAARAIGEIYDGYADPVETPNNWVRAESAAAAALAALVEPSDAVVEAMARSLIIEDDAGDADGILAATMHAGDCQFVDSPASYTCARCQGDHYRQLARAAWRAGMVKVLGRTE